MDKQIQYIGARYVTKIYENSSDPSSAEWESNVDYEPLTMVTFNRGSYLSKKYVPATVGNPADNPIYWVKTGDYNGQIAELERQIEILNEALEHQIDNLDETLRRVIAETGNDLLEVINRETTNRTNADSNLQEQINNETNARNEAINSVETLIETETEDRETADSNLQTQINQIIAPTGEAPSAAEVENARIGANGTTYATLGTAIRTQVEELDDSFKYTEDELNSLYFKMRKNLVNPHKFVNGYLNSVGELVAGDSYRTTGAIYINKSGSYVKRIENDSAFGNAAKNIYVYDSSGTYIKAIEGTSVSTHWYSYTISSGDVGNFIRFSSGNTNESGIYFGIGDSALDNIPPFNFDLGAHGFVDQTQIKNPSALSAPYFTSSANKVNPSDLFNGYIKYSTGEVIADNTYRTTGMIKIEQSGDYMKHINAPSSLGSSNVNIGIFDGDGNYITFIVGTNESNGWFSYNISADYVGLYVRFTSGNTSESGIYFGTGDTIPSSIPEYGFALNESGKVDYSQITNKPVQLYDYKSALTDKVWYLLGDSATHGDFSTIVQPPLADGIYAGELPVYPFYIGNRTGMIVHNLAVNGATMAEISDQPSRYQWAVDEHYQLVDSDADFITIWIGANDMWQSVPIGTIDSNDDTTFYGAFNKVLTWYINNRPNAKLGLVASFWCNQAYAEAVIAIGAKYGIPVLNFYSDPNIPVSVGSQRADVSSTIKTIRDNQYRVSETNSHPSAKYHELESYFIEEWLKTL